MAQTIEGTIQEYGKFGDKENCWGYEIICGKIEKKNYITFMHGRYLVSGDPSFKISDIVNICDTKEDANDAAHEHIIGKPREDIVRKLKRAGQEGKVVDKTRKGIEKELVTVPNV